MFPPRERGCKVQSGQTTQKVNAALLGRDFARCVCDKAGDLSAIHRCFIGDLSVIYGRFACTPFFGSSVFNRSMAPSMRCVLFQKSDHRSPCF